jgi:hypothetical protein
MLAVGVKSRNYRISSYIPRADLENRGAQCRQSAGQTGMGKHRSCLSRSGGIYQYADKVGISACKCPA